MKIMNSNNRVKGQAGNIYIILVIIIFLIGGLTFFCASHHIVKTSGGIKVYPKKTLSFNDSFVDMTSMSFMQLRHHKGLVSVMAHKGDLKYLPGGEALIKAKQAGIAVSEAIKQFDNEHQITNSVNEMARIGREKYREIDAKYDISGKAKKSKEIMRDQAKKFNKWLKKH